MASVRARRPPVRNRTRIEPLETNTRTLAQHYRRKLARNRLIPARAGRRAAAARLHARAPATRERARRIAVARAMRASLTAAVSRAVASEPL